MESWNVITAKRNKVKKVSNYC
jgi:hypothetical protein